MGCNYWHLTTSYQLCTVFIHVYRVIRLSSPNLNYITCAGAIVLLLSAFFIASPSATTSLFPFLCMVNKKWTRNIDIFSELVLLAIPIRINNLMYTITLWLKIMATGVGPEIT